MASTTGFVIVPIARSVIDHERSIAASAVVPSVVKLEAAGGEPLRCCLRNAVSRESLILFSYEPPLPQSPYQEKGAVFAHATSCHSAPDLRSYPSDWRGRPQVLRAYDERGWIRAASVHDGSSPEAAINAALEDPEVVEIHSRNVAYGCYMFTLRRDEE
jgi:hypothetical protein